MGKSAVHRWNSPGPGSYLDRQWSWRRGEGA